MRASRSAPTSISPPASAAGAISRAGSPRTAARTRWGAARPTKPITPDTATWQAATAYDNGKQPDLGSWKDGSANGLTLSGRDLGSPVTAALTTPPTAGLVVRLDVDATAPATVSVSGTTTTPFERTVIAAAGHSALFVTVPPGLADGTLTLQRNGGTGTLTVTSMSVRALP